MRTVDDMVWSRVSSELDWGHGNYILIYSPRCSPTALVGTECWRNYVLENEEGWRVQLRDVSPLLVLPPM